MTPEQMENKFDGLTDGRIRVGMDGDIGSDIINASLADIGFAR